MITFGARGKQNSGRDERCCQKNFSVEGTEGYKLLAIK